MCTYICIDLGKCKCIYVNMYLCIYVSMYVCIYIYVYMYMCIYAYMYMCIHVYMYIWIHVYMYICIQNKQWYMKLQKPNCPNQNLQHVHGIVPGFYWNLCVCSAYSLDESLVWDKTSLQNKIHLWWFGWISLLRGKMSAVYCSGVCFARPFALHKFWKYL